MRNDRFFVFFILQCMFYPGIMSSEWGKCTMKPIPSGSTSDTREPSSYDNFALLYCMYKVYCTVLNATLSAWTVHRLRLWLIGLLVNNEQSGFAKQRSTTDHLCFLTTIIKTRKKLE